MGRLQYTPESEIQNRIRAVQTQLAQTPLNGLMVTHHTNLFYFSGTSQDGVLYIPKTGRPVLMIRRSYERALKESAIEDIVKLSGLRDILPNLKERYGTKIGSVGLELDVVPYNTFVFYRDTLLPGIDLTDGTRIFKQARLIKSEYEINLIRHSCSIMDQAFSKAPEWICEGKTEIEIASRFEAFMRKSGYGGCNVRAFNRDLFYGNMTSGSNASKPSYFDGPVNGVGLSPANNPIGAGWKKIQKDEPVYVDYSCVIDGYTADAERIYVIGKLDADLVSAHKTALVIQEELIRLMRPGTLWSDVWDLSVRIADEQGLLNHYMGMGEERVKFVGHGVGLELDEQPIFARGFDLELEKGMTFALEPKFVFDRGAVGIENTFAVTQTGVEKLTAYGEDIHYI